MSVVSIRPTLGEVPWRIPAAVSFCNIELSITNDYSRASFQEFR